MSCTCILALSICLCQRFAAFQKPQRRKSSSYSSTKQREALETSTSLLKDCFKGEKEWTSDDAKIGRIQRMIKSSESKGRLSFVIAEVGGMYYLEGNECFRSLLPRGVLTFFTFYIFNCMTELITSSPKMVVKCFRRNNIRV